MTRVRCISLWQPFASLMLAGKILETRGWNTKVRGPVFIHAGATKVFVRELLKCPAWWVDAVEQALQVEAHNWTRDLPFGGIIGRGDLVEAMTTEDALVRFPAQKPFGDFAPGRFAHRYTKLAKLPLLELKGRQRFFFADVPDYYPALAVASPFA